MIWLLALVAKVAQPDAAAVGLAKILRKNDDYGISRDAAIYSSSNQYSYFNFSNNGAKSQMIEPKAFAKLKAKAAKYGCDINERGLWINMIDNKNLFLMRKIWPQLDEHDYASVKACQMHEVVRVLNLAREEGRLEAGNIRFKAAR